MPYQYALSIIIPTRNRWAFLRDALDSLKSEVAEDIPVEIIVIDNGSTDSTRDVVAAFAAIAACPVVYLYEGLPGLHVGRHLGAERSRAPLLAYLDDDVIVQPGWLRAVVERFGADDRIALVGGPCRPLWEAPPPPWVDSFRDECLGGWCLSQLSLLDLGSEAKAIPAQYVFGCNYCIRKDILYQFGGFHPDGLPSHLLRYRGDGETGLATAIESSRYQVLYEPRAAIEHRVPASRLTASYFRHIAYRAGISVAYSILRRHGKAKPRTVIDHAFRLLASALRAALLRAQAWTTGNPSPPALRQGYKALLHYSILRHFLRFVSDADLRKWICQESYFAPCALQYCPEGDSNHKGSAI